MNLTTTAPSHHELVEEVNELIACHRAAIDVCDDVATRVDDLQLRVRIRELITHHFREVEELSHWVAELGARPSRATTDAKKPKEEIDDDADLVRIVLNKEQQVARAFEQVLQNHDETSSVVQDLKSVARKPRHQREAVVRSLAAEDLN